jgi:hypothetical protein
MCRFAGRCAHWTGTCRRVCAFDLDLSGSPIANARAASRCIDMLSNLEVSGAGWARWRHPVKKTSITVAAAAFVLLAVATAFGAAPDEKVPPQTVDIAEMMKRAQKLITPGEPHKLLERFLGMWDTGMRFNSPGVPAQDEKGTATYSWLMEGRWLRGEWTTTMYGKPRRWRRGDRDPPPHTRAPSSSSAGATRIPSGVWNDRRPSAETCHVSTAGNFALR